MKQLFLALFLYPTVSLAGWTSGGGELLGDSVNPWWVKNTKNLNYCISINQNTFNQTEEDLNRVVVKALSFWKKEFKEITYSEYPHTSQTAQQKFTRTACSEKTDLKFQFGYLTEEQKKKVQDSERFVSLAVRTDYDQVNLKGKGFVYVSDRLARKDETELLYVLLHELGHVFGLPHTGRNNFDLMAEDFVESVIKGRIPSNLKNIPSYFSSVDGTITIQTSNNLGPRKFFKVEEELSEISLVSTVVGERPGYEVWATKKIGGKAKLGNILSEPDQTPVAFVKEATSFYLPKEQRVFPKNVEIGVPQFSYSMFKGTYSNDTESREVGIYFSPGLIKFPQIIGTVDDKLFIHALFGL